MAFEDDIRTLAGRIPDPIESLATEEATKQTLILPFLQALGYDTSNHTEVIPEFTADKGASVRVDYAIMSYGKPIILVECKKASDNLSLARPVSQLSGYFAPTDARIGILTNGITYRFFSDFEKENIMDGKPFWEIDISDLDDNDPELLIRLFAKGFDVSATLDSASRLKDIGMMARVLKQQHNAPQEDFVAKLVRLAYPKKRIVMNGARKERLKHLTKLAFDEFVSDAMRAAQKRSNDATEEGEEVQSKIVTTAQEQEAYHIVKALVRTVVASNRVSYIDRVGHFSIMLDQNQKKLLCRLRFNNEHHKQIGLFDENRAEIRHPIESLDDIYTHAEQIRETARRYLEPSTE